MIITKKYFITMALLMAIAYTSFAQSTINSPYSKFGIGNLKGAYLPQNKAMGNLAYGISSYGGYQNINISNPASYSQIQLTTFDIGAGISSQSLSRGSLTEKSFNATLNHLVFAVPVTPKSALSLGLLPYSSLGYDFKNLTKVDIYDIAQIYSGEGGLTRAYLGYGFGIGKHLSAGINMSYLFGNLKQTRSVEYTNSIGFLNSRTTESNSIGGLNFDLGLQYNTILTEKIKLTVGYTGGLKTNINTKSSILTTRYSTINDTEFRSDSISSTPEKNSKLVLPANHNFGFSISKLNAWLIGADVRLANWSESKINGNSQNLNNTWGVSVGGQITPNINAVTNYLKLVDYRAGISYDKTYLTLNGQDINVKSLNIGLGLPLISNRSAFYKINITGEFGQRGTLDNNLVRENFYNVYLGFTINDRWFQKYKYD